MLHAKYQPKWHCGSGEKSFKRFLPYMGMAAILILNHDLFILILCYHQINAKYEISFKLAQYFHRKCHLNCFMNGCHGNQSCHAIFIKTSKYNQNIVFNIPMKN